MRNDNTLGGYVVYCLGTLGKGVSREEAESDWKTIAGVSYVFKGCQLFQLPDNAILSTVSMSSSGGIKWEVVYGTDVMCEAELLHVY